MPKTHVPMKVYMKKIIYNIYQFINLYIQYSKIDRSSRLDFCHHYVFVLHTN